MAAGPSSAKSPSRLTWASFPHAFTTPLASSSAVASKDFTWYTLPDSPAVATLKRAFATSLGWVKDIGESLPDGRTTLPLSIILSKGSASVVSRGPVALAARTTLRRISPPFFENSRISISDWSFAFW